MKKRLACFLALATTALAGGYSSTAHASLMDQFLCDAGDMGIMVMWNPLEPNQVVVDISVSEMMDQSLAKQYTIPLVEEGGDARIFKGEGTTFEMVGGNYSFSFDGDPDYLECQFQASEQPEDDGKSGAMLDILGRSLGGKVRSGPGTQFDRLAGIPNRAPIAILRNTGVTFDGYDWFEIQTSSGLIGFQWGGIMCSGEGQKLDGLYEACK